MASKKLRVPRTGWLAVALVGVALLVVAAVISGAVGGRGAPAAEHTASHGAPHSSPSAIVAEPPSPTNRPNIVFVLTDDLSTNLVQYMPHVQAMERAGMSFTNYTVTDSLCCPSRASIFTGRFPHNTGVFRNSGVDGGFHVFHRRGEENDTFAVALQKAGYRTALMGKYLNGYDPGVTYGANGMPLPAQHLGARGLPENNWVPPGWTTWDGVGDGYGEFDYTMAHNHTVQYYGHAADDYGVDVISRLAQGFIASSAAAHQPFFLETATFAPHTPYTPAPRDADSFRDVRAPRTPAWDTVPRHAPAWLAHQHKLTASDIAVIDDGFRQRVRSVQSVDRMIAALYDEVRRAGQLDNTIFVFSSDNGLHMGEYRLTPGKLTAFDIDVNVPLVVTGPGIAADSTNAAVTQNIDLAPTFEALAGAPPGPLVDGRSLVPLLHSEPDVRWRTTALIEHHSLAQSRSDPDLQPASAGKTPSYEAMRTATYTYVRYDDGEREYYDRATDPWMLDNIYDTLSPERIAQLNEQLDELEVCAGEPQCAAAEGSTTVQ